MELKGLDGVLHPSERIKLLRWKQPPDSVVDEFQSVESFAASVWEMRRSQFDSWICQNVLKRFLGQPQCTWNCRNLEAEVNSGLKSIISSWWFQWVSLKNSWTDVRASSCYWLFVQTKPKGTSWWILIGASLMISPAL